jgi:hypothetical protein
MFYFEKNVSFAEHKYAEACICCSFSHIDKICYNTSTTTRKVFMIQKRVLRIMLGIGTRSSCRTWFIKSDILTVPSFYIFSFMMFVVNNADNFQDYSPVHSINMRHKNQLHIPLVKFSSIQICVLTPI